MELDSIINKSNVKTYNYNFIGLGIHVTLFTLNLHVILVRLIPDEDFCYFSRKFGKINILP